MRRAKQPAAEPALPTVLALDLEGTLISSAVSQIPRPGLHLFLTTCAILFPRICVMTAVNEPRFRTIAQTLVAEGLAPEWFASVEYVVWEGATKDLRFVPHAEVRDVLLVDDLADYVSPGQEAQHISIEQFNPRSDVDKELARVLKRLQAAVSPLRK